MDYLEYPPVVYRMIARDGSRALGPDEIARRSGLSRSTVQRISAKPWINVRIGAYQAFIRGCVGDVPVRIIKQRIKALQETGIARARHLNPSPKSKLFRRGAAGNTRKFLIRVISKTQ